MPNPNGTLTPEEIAGFPAQQRALADASPRFTTEGVPVEENTIFHAGTGGGNGGPAPAPTAALAGLAAGGDTGGGMGGGIAGAPAPSADSGAMLGLQAAAQPEDVVPGYKPPQMASLNPDIGKRNLPGVSNLRALTY